MHGLRVMVRVWSLFFKKIGSMFSLKGMSKFTKYVPHILNMGIFLFVILYLYFEIIFPFIKDISDNNQYKSLLFVLLALLGFLFFHLLFKFSESIAQIQEEDSKKG